MKEKCLRNIKQKQPSKQGKMNRRYVQVYEKQNRENNNNTLLSM